MAERRKRCGRSAWGVSDPDRWGGSSPAAPGARGGGRAQVRGRDRSEWAGRLIGGGLAPSSACGGAGWRRGGAGDGAVSFPSHFTVRGPRRRCTWAHPESDPRPRQRRGGQGWPPALPFALGAWCPGRRLGRGPRALPDASQRLDQKQETERRSLCCPRRLLGGGGRTAER